MVVKRTVKAITFGSLFGYMTGQFTDSQLMIFTGAILGALSSEFVISPLAWKVTESLYTRQYAKSTRMSSEFNRRSESNDEYGFRVNGQIPRVIYLLDPSGVDMNPYILVSEFPRILKDTDGNLCDRHGDVVRGEAILERSHPMLLANGEVFFIPDKV